MTESFDIGELLTLAKDNSPESRTRLFGMMGDLFLNKGGYLSTEERTNLSGILSTLLPQADKESRLKLASDLSGSTAVPRDLARRIGEDEIEVATPMLVKSTKLTDQDLIELAARSPQHAGVIATRRGLPMAVADTLMRGGQTDVVQALLDNASSQISVAALHTALEKAKDSEDLQDSISRRVELPEEIAAELMEWAGGRVRERLMDRFNILMVELLPPSEADEEVPPLDLNQYNRANGVVVEPEPDLADMPPTGFARYGAATNATPQPIGLSSLKPKPKAESAPEQGNAEEDARLEEARLAEAEALRTKAKKDLVAKTLAALAHDNHPEPAAAVPPAAPVEPAAAPVEEPHAEEPAPAIEAAIEPEIEEEQIEYVPPPSLKRDLAAERLTFDAVDMELELIDVGDAADMPPLAEPMTQVAQVSAPPPVAMDFELELEQVPESEMAPPAVAQNEEIPAAIEADEVVAEETAATETAPIEAPISEAAEVEAPEVEAPEVEAPEVEAPEAETPAVAAAEIESVAADTLADVEPAEVLPDEVAVTEISAAELPAIETTSTLDVAIDVAAETLDVAESFSLAESTAPESVVEIAPEVVDAPIQEEPASEVAAIEEVAAEEPVVEEPHAEDSIAEEPAIEAAAPEVAARDEAAAEEPRAEDPIAEEPVAEEIAAESFPEELTREDAVAIEEPIADEPVAEASAVEAPPVEEPVAEEPIAEEPITDEPVAEEIAADAAPQALPREEATAIEVPIAEEAVTEKPVVEEPVAEESVVAQSTADEEAEVPEAAGVTEPEAMEEPLAAVAPPAAEVSEPVVAPAEAKMGEAKTEEAPAIAEPVAKISDPKKEALLDRFIKSALASEKQPSEPTIEAPIAPAEPTVPISDPKKEALLSKFIKSALASAAKVIPGVSAEPLAPEARAPESPAHEAPVSKAPLPETSGPETPEPEAPVSEAPASEAPVSEISAPEARPEETPVVSAPPEEVRDSEEPLVAAVEPPAAATEAEAVAEEVAPQPEPESQPEPEPESKPEPRPVEPAAAARSPLPKGAEHKLTTTLVIAMLNNGGLARAEAMFAQMTGLRIGLVRRLAAESGGEGLAMAARAIHMSREDFSTIYLLWRKLKSRDGFVSTNDHGKALDFFDSAPQDRVMSVMTRWRKDPEKLFATG